MDTHQMLMRNLPQTVLYVLQVKLVQEVLKQSVQQEPTLMLDTKLVVHVRLGFIVLQVVQHQLRVLMEKRLKLQRNLVLRVSIVPQARIALMEFKRCV